MEGKRYALTNSRWDVGFGLDFGRFDWSDMPGAVSPRVVFMDECSTQPTVQLVVGKEWRMEDGKDGREEGGKGKTRRREGWKGSGTDER